MPSQLPSEDPKPATGYRKPADARRVTTDFDWLVYADATFAGLSILVPIPFVDSLMEEIFRRRMPRNIGRRRGRALPLAAIREVNRKRGKGCLSGCLMLPLNGLIYVLRNLYRTVVYVLSVVDAADNLSFYWHRAFLLDYMIGRGHLDDARRAAIGAEAMDQILETTQTSPLRNLAQQVIETAGRQLRGLMRTIFRFLRRKEETVEARRVRLSIADHWAEFSDYFIELADRYDAAYEAIERERELAAAAPYKPPA